MAVSASCELGGDTAFSLEESFFAYCVGLVGFTNKTYSYTG